MISCSPEDAAYRAGVEPGYLTRLVSLGILGAEERDRYSPADVRRVMMVKSLEESGVSRDGVAAAIERGALSFDFLAGAFADIGPVELKGVSGTVHLLRPHLASPG